MSKNNNVLGVISIIISIFALGVSIYSIHNNNVISKNQQQTDKDVTYLSAQLELQNDETNIRKAQLATLIAFTGKCIRNLPINYSSNKIISFETNERLIKYASADYAKDLDAFMSSLDELLFFYDDNEMILSKYDYMNKLIETLNLQLFLTRSYYRILVSDYKLSLHNKKHEFDEKYVIKYEEYLNQLSTCLKYCSDGFKMLYDQNTIIDEKTLSNNT